MLLDASSVPPQLRKETAQRGRSASPRPQSCLEPEPGLKRFGPFTWRLASCWGPDSRNWSGNLPSLRPPNGTPEPPPPQKFTAKNPGLVPFPHTGNGFERMGWSQEGSGPHLPSPPSLAPAASPHAASEVISYACRAEMKHVPQNKWC